MTGWRRVAQYPAALLVRFLMFILGFYWIDVVGKPCSSKEARVVVGAPHSTVFDTLYLVYAFSLPSSISKAENQNLPMAGTTFRAMQAIAVDRENRGQKDQALQLLKARASDPEQRHVLVFPEGTCTNRRALITFKRGAFAAGQPVQPVCLEWPWTGFDLTWTAGGPNRLALFLHALCQPYLRLKVTFLPVYKPNEEEQKDPILFAKNVRALMAKTLDIPVTGHSYEDMFLAKEARKLRVPLNENVPFELHELSTLYQINLEDAKGLLKRYAAIYKKNERVDGPGLAKILGIPYTAPVKDLFDLLKDDQHADDEEGIDFKQLLIGIAHLSKALNVSDLEGSIELVWEAVADGQPEVTEKVLYDRLSHVFSEFSRDFSKNMFKKADKEKQGKITFEMFKSYIKQRPEFLFVAVETIAQRSQGSRRLSVLVSPKETKSKQVTAPSAVVTTAKNVGSSLEPANQPPAQQNGAH
jgi:lysophosphatidylcholine acyltransferase/lyso-PAF acetyltransferase